MYTFLGGGGGVDCSAIIDCRGGEAPPAVEMAPASISALKLWMKPHGIFLFYMVGGCFVAKNTLAHAVLNKSKFLAPGNFSKYLELGIEVGVPHWYW